MGFLYFFALVFLIVRAVRATSWIMLVGSLGSAALIAAVLIALMFMRVEEE